MPRLTRYAKSRPIFRASNRIRLWPRPPPGCSIGPRHRKRSGDFLRQRCRSWRQTLGGEYVAFVEGAKGHWRTIAASGPERAVADDLLAESLDEERPVVQRRLVCRSAGFASRRRRPAGGLSQRWSTAVEHGGTLRHALALAGRRHSSTSAAGSATTTDRPAGSAAWKSPPSGRKRSRWTSCWCRWPRPRRACCDAERASIFLWDRTTQTLVGRPALGVPRRASCELPTMRASWGRWFTRGQPRRVDEDVAAEQREIDRRVDQRLKFQTRSLLCVPLRGQSGELFGRVRSHQQDRRQLYGR